MAREYCFIIEPSGIETRANGVYDQLDAAIRQKAEQIKQLTQEMEQHQQQKEQLKKEIQDASSSMEKTKGDFVASFNQLVSQISTDMDKMKRYLKWDTLIRSGSSSVTPELWTKKPHLSWLKTISSLQPICLKVKTLSLQCFR